MNIRFFAAAAEATGMLEWTLTSETHLTLSQFSQCLLQQFPALKELLAKCSFLVNGQALHNGSLHNGSLHNGSLHNSEVLLPKDASIDILPPFAGG